MSEVTVERDGHVLLIGVDRADKRNAWTLAIIDQVAAAHEQLSTDEDVRAGVHGHGDHLEGLLAGIMGSEDVAEGAFLERRPGRFTGR